MKHPNISASILTRIFRPDGLPNDVYRLPLIPSFPLVNLPALLSSPTAWRCRRATRNPPRSFPSAASSSFAQRGHPGKLSRGEFQTHRGHLPDMQKSKPKGRRSLAHRLPLRPRHHSTDNMNTGFLAQHDRIVL